MPGSGYWESVTLERTHCCELTGLEGTNHMTSSRLEDYFNSPNEKVRSLRRPEMVGLEIKTEREVGDGKGRL